MALSCPAGGGTWAGLARLRLAGIGPLMAVHRQEAMTWQVRRSDRLGTFVTQRTRTRRDRRAMRPRRRLPGRRPRGQLASIA